MFLQMMQNTICYSGADLGEGAGGVQGVQGAGILKKKINK